MRNIFRTTAILLIMSSCMSAQANSKTLDNFVAKVSSSLVSFDYTFSCQVRNSKMTGEGSVRLQDDAFFVKGNGLDIYCDGKTKWTVDTFSEEALIESVEESADSYATNPALLITCLDKAFNEVSCTTKDGKDVSLLVPIQKGKSSSDLAEVKLVFKSGTEQLVGAQVKLNDGTVTDFVVKAIKFAEKTKGKESFRLNEKTLGSSYVITDLR